MLFGAVISARGLRSRTVRAPPFNLKSAVEEGWELAEARRGHGLTLDWPPERYAVTILSP